MIIESGITIGSSISISDLPTVPYIGELYTFSTFTFTTGNTVGPTGANTRWLFANSYSTSNASNVWLTNTSYFGMSKAGYQYWIVPQTAQYTIEAAGSRTGFGLNYTGNTTLGLTRHGRGAVVRGTFTLEQGTNVTIAVGQPSANTTLTGTYTTPGGGGGTFVVLPGNFPLIVAGGGGSLGLWTSNTTHGFGGNGVTTTFGGNSFNGAPGGFNGMGGNSHVNRNGVISSNQFDGGGGGGMWNPGVAGAGGNARPGSTATGQFGQGGWHFLANLQGGVSSTGYPPPGTSPGGFGGGAGSGPISGGGGGGYSGGGGGFGTTNTITDSGGGGGSWIASNATSVATSDGFYNLSSTFNTVAITNLSTVNNAAGYVRITKL
jgi:hypothetical protein